MPRKREPAMLDTQDRSTIEAIRDACSELLTQGTAAAWPQLTAGEGEQFDRARSMLGELNQLIRHGRADMAGRWSPNREQVIALQQYAEEMGEFWKDALRVDWLRGSRPGLLQQVRNQGGPQWLLDWEFPKSLPAKVGNAAMRQAHRFLSCSPLDVYEMRNAMDEGVVELARLCDIDDESARELIERFCSGRFHLPALQA